MCGKQRCHLWEEKHGMNGEETHSIDSEKKHGMDVEEKHGWRREGLRLTWRCLSLYVTVPTGKGACAIYCHLRKSRLKFAHFQWSRTSSSNVVWVWFKRHRQPIHCTLNGYQAWDNTMPRSEVFRRFVKTGVSTATVSSRIRLEFLLLMVWAAVVTQHTF